MPNLDPDPFSPWSSSSSEASTISQTNNLCWWRTVRTSKTIKSRSNLTQAVRLDKFNQRSEASRCNSGSPYYRGLTDARLIIHRQGLSRTSRLEKYLERFRYGTATNSCCPTIEVVSCSSFESKGKSEVAETHMTKSDSLPLMRKVEGSSSLVDMEKEFKWERKYQPKALTDFICHREKAILLLSNMVYKIA